MTREEEIKQAAKNRANQYERDSSWNDTFYGFIDGAKWADNTIIEKVYKLLVEQFYFTEQEAKDFINKLTDN